jgi:hypothetical protein
MQTRNQPRFQPAIRVSEARISRRRSLFVVAGLLVAACGGGSNGTDTSSEQDGPPSTGTGGASAAGGFGRGGATGSGGLVGTGGVVGVGGLASTGGFLGTGGGTPDAAPDAVDAAPDVARADAIVAPVDIAVLETVGGYDAAGPEPLTVKDPYFTTTEEDDGMHAFVMPWADRSAGPTDLSGLNQEVVPLSIGSDGHIYRNGARYRLFGTNIAYGSCHPTHEMADIIAARLAKLGFNAVRLHGCEMFPGWPYERSIIEYSGVSSGKLDAERLDRFDYLLAALRKRGIYIYLGLETARRFLPEDSGDPSSPMPVPAATAGDVWGDDDMQEHKAMSMFYDPMIAAQQRFVRDLLGHKNPYTLLTLAKDPALAWLEIINESGLVNYWLWDRLEKMPAPFLAELQRKWNAWLLAKYATSAATNVAWGGTPTATELLSNTVFVTPISPWILETSAPAVATATTEAAGDGTSPALRINITTAGTESWHVQLAQGGLTLQAGHRYKISFRAKASDARIMKASVDRPDPYLAYSPYQAQQLGTTWQDYTVSFIAGTEVPAAGGARLSLTDFGLQTGTVWFSQPSLLQDGPILKPGETIESGTVPIVSHLDAQSAMALDWIRFLRDTEASYFGRMADFLKKDVAVAAALVGSQVITSPPSVQAKLDVIDNHAYWDELQFLGTAYDRNNYSITNTSAVYSPPGPMGPIAAARVFGKPLFATEIGWHQPNQFAGEGPLLSAAYGALQDLDGIFEFAWGSNGHYEPDGFGDHTDFDHHPPKLASIPVAASLFRSFDVSAATKVITVAMDPDRELAGISTAAAWHGIDTATRNLPYAAATISRIESNLASGATDSGWPDLASTTQFVSDTGELSWDKSAGVVTVNSARTRAVIGFSGGQTYALGGPSVDCSLASGPCVVIKPGKGLLGHSTIGLHLVEGSSFATGAGRALLSATGTIRNTAMQWNASKTSTAGNWGYGPTRVEVVSAEVTLPRAAAEVAVYALDGRGQRIARVPVSGTTTAAFQTGGSLPTVWYEVVLGGAAAKGEGDHVLDACATYCTQATAALPACYPSATACLQDCAAWAAEALGSSRCDCTAEVDAFFACDKASTERICGRLSQGVPPSNACLSAYLDAFKCAGRIAPCTKGLVEELVDDFEDGDVRAAHSGFSSWSITAAAAGTVTPNPFAPAVHGAIGSGYAAHLRGVWSAGANWATLTVGTARSAGIDLSGYVGVAFSAKGTGTLRVVFGTTDMDAAGNSDRYGRVYDLASPWRRYLLRFDDPDFAQAGWGGKATFSPSQVSGIHFTSGAAGTAELWIDDVVLLKAR